MDLSGMTASHFIFIPSVLLVGVVIGWILGSRAAADAYAAQARKQAARSQTARPNSQNPNPKPQ